MKIELYSACRRGAYNAFVLFDFEKAFGCHRNYGRCDTCNTAYVKDGIG